MVELARKHFAYKKYWLKPSSDESPSLVVSTTGPRTLIQEAWIHSPGSRSYSTQPALPFSNCTIKESQYGWNPVKEKTDTTNSDTVPGGNVGLFFLTLNDHATVDQLNLNAYKNFRLDAEQSKFKHFLKNSPKLSWKASPDSRPRSLHCSSSYTLSRG